MPAEGLLDRKDLRAHGQLTLLEKPVGDVEPLGEAVLPEFVQGSAPHVAQASLAELSQEEGVELVGVVFGWSGRFGPPAGAVALGRVTGFPAPASLPPRQKAFVEKVFQYFRGPGGIRVKGLGQPPGLRPVDLEHAMTLPL